jgi:sporulation protein YlmC with PRC-barrel domain
MTRSIPQFATAAAIAALFAFGNSSAWAQSSMSTPGAGSGSRSAAPTSNGPSSSSSAPMKNPLASEDISQIDGTSVAGSDGGKIGSVSTVLMDPSSKKVDRLVVSEGGVLGVGSHRVALPIDSFRWDPQNHNFVIQKSADDLKAMPEWQQPQLAENPSAGGASSSAGVGAGTSGGAPAGAASAPPASTTPAPSGNAR